MSAAKPRRFTGRHATIILVAFFAVVIAVNVLMARLASSTFGGVVVENSYVASQNYNRWLDQAKQEQALGWSVKLERMGGSRISAQLTGVGAEAANLTATVRHPLGRMADRALTFRRNAAGGFISDQPLPAGRWQLRLEARDGARLWRSEQAL